MKTLGLHFFTTRGLRRQGRLSRSSGLVAALLFGVPGLVGAQTPPQTPRTPTPATTSKYVLGAGDTLNIVVAGHAEFNQTLTIPPDGTVTLARLGTVRLSGKTRLQVQNELSALVITRARIRQPQVAVSITGLKPIPVERVVLSGDVPRAGSFDISKGQRLSVLLANVGLQDRLEERRATLTRGAKTSALDLKAAANTPRGVADIQLRGGDVISVRQLTPGRITLDGDVTRAGEYELHLNPRGAMELNLAPRLSDLLRKAGGLREASNPILPVGTEMPGAAPGTAPALTPAEKTVYEAYLQRGGRKIELKPETALTDDNSAANIRLLPGDVVRVKIVPPKPNITVYLDGLDKQLAAKSVREDTTVLELLASAGGTAKVSEGVTGTLRRGAQVSPLDLNALLLNSESPANVKLQSGDIVQMREPDTITVRVEGGVVRPGPLRLKPGSTIFEALLDAGNLSIPREETRLIIARKEADGTQNTFTANAADILTTANMETNAVLREGDILNVLQVQKQTVFISGQVNTPGLFQLREGEGLPQLIIRAGGAKEDALLTQISVKRNGEVVKVDAYDSIKTNAPLKFDLQNDDVVLVPQNLNRVLVMEAVSKPGYYAIPERGQLTLLDLVAQAGPATKTNKIVLMRAGADGAIDQKVKPREIKLEDVRNGKASNVVLQPRDIVYVPSPSSGPNFFQKVLPILSFSRFFGF